ncbi:replication protein A 70 kDa DNA-binding subunit B-like [Silene latifolia]|uniref:replication protein A 70 kDa DNA-binding subunit B-like n=1 Tax=Silene latifolia TaxID=37657 RepID=UPI003D77B0AA
MRGALFADQVDQYEDAFKHNRLYEITNAPISPLKPEYKLNPTDVDFQMNFGRRTIVLPVDIDDGTNTIDYRPISHLPRATDYTEMFDIVGVVLFVEEHSRKVTTNKNRETNVREIVLTDHSTPQPLSISVWDDLAEDDCTMLIPEPGKFRIVGLTALRVSNHKGFSMTTSSSTVIIHSLLAKAEALKIDANVIHFYRMASHHTSLTQLQSRLFHVKLPMPNEKTTKISALRAKKAKSALQDEKHWLEVTIPAAELHKVHAYIGCSKCAKTSSMPPGRPYTCNNCSAPDCTSVPKITFNCEILDGTGTLPMTVFTQTAERLFKMSAANIFHMKHSDHEEAFSVVQELLRTTPFKVQVGPSTSLSVNNILQWVVKRVVVDDEDDTVSKSEPVQEPIPESQVIDDSEVRAADKQIVPDQSATNVTTTPAEDALEISSYRPKDLQRHSRIANYVQEKGDRKEHGS